MLNSNLGTIHCKVLSQTNGSVQSFTFSGTMGGRKPFLYYHGCQVSKRGTLICGVIQDEGIMVADKIYGDADIEIDKLTIKTTLLNSWSYGYVIYFS